LPFFLLSPDYDAVVPARYNIAPTQRTPIVRSDLRAAVAGWGFGGAHTFNARAETADERPLYRRAFHERPALVPANGWFEWEPTPSGKRPYYLCPIDGALALFAGIWEMRGGAPCFSILTRPSRFELAPIHHREPVVIGTEDALRWLDERLPPQQRRELLAPRTDTAPQFYVREVTRAVNSIDNDGPELLGAPTVADAARDLPLFAPPTEP